jgi:hypothetical protein
VERDNQILGETVDVAGTPFTLHYQSDRVPGRTAPYTLAVPLTGGTVPPYVTSIDLDLNIAGQDVTQSFTPAPNLSFPFTWNRLDGFGRQLQGPGPWTAAVSYVSGSGRSVVLDQRTFGGALGSFDARGVLGLGGWTLDEQHFYDLTTGTLYYGNGARRAIASKVNQPQVLNLVAGNGQIGGGGDAGQAREAQLVSPAGLSLMHDGSLLIADAGACTVRKVAPDGTITTIAGSSTRCSAADQGTTGTGDGGLATAAVLGRPMKAVEGPAPDYPIYIADFLGERIRKIDAKGIITTVAGNGQWGCTGNEVAAPVDLAVEASGSLLIANQALVETGDPSQSCDSIVRMPPGGGAPSTVVGYEYYPESDLPDPSFLKWPAGVAAGRDGSVYFTPANALLRRPPGGGDDAQHPFWIVGGIDRFYGLPGDVVFAGDGLPASVDNTRFNGPGEIALAPDGSIYVVDYGNQRVRRLSPAEIVSTVAGGGTTIPAGDGTPATQAALQGPVGLALDGTGKNLYLSDIYLHQVWKLLVPGAAPGISPADHQCLPPRGWVRIARHW